MNTKKNKTPCVYAVKRNGEVTGYMVRKINKGISTYLGYYRTEEEASKAYQAYVERTKNNQEVYKR